MLFLLLLIAFVQVFSQAVRLDSLLQAESRMTAKDTEMVKLYMKIALEYRKTSLKDAIRYADKAIDLAEQLNAKMRLAGSLNIRGQLEYAAGKPENALKLFQKSLLEYEFLGDTSNIGHLQSNIGILYMDLSDFVEAEKWYTKSINTFRSAGMVDKLCKPMNNLGICYTRAANYPKALDILLQALAIATESGDKIMQANLFNEIGNVYNYIDDKAKAREYYFKSLDIRIKTDLKKEIADLYVNIALTYQGTDRVKAMQMHAEAITIYEEIRQSRALPSAYSNMANEAIYMNNTEWNEVLQGGLVNKMGSQAENPYLFSMELVNRAIKTMQGREQSGTYSFCLYVKSKAFRYLHQYDSAVLTGMNGLAIAQKLNTIKNQQEALKNLADIYEDLMRYDSAYIYNKKYMVIRDSIINEKNREEIVRKEMQYEFNLKEKDLLCRQQLTEAEARQVSIRLNEELLLAKNREQELRIQSAIIALRDREVESHRLAYLKNMADLQVISMEKKDRERQLNLSEQENLVQGLKLSNRSLQRNILLVAILLSIFILYLIFRGYARQKKSNQKLNGLNRELSATLQNLEQTQEQLILTEKQKENETIRRRISQDIHDDISSGLTRISWLTTLVKENIKQGQATGFEEDMNKIVATSRETIDRLGEIIWAINPDRDNLEGFYAYIRTYIMSYLENTPYQAVLDFPEEQTEVVFNPEVKRSLFLVLKEAIHNIVKHANGNRVELVFQCHDHRFIISISDNGKGFDPAGITARNNGMRNMKQRMEYIGGNFEIQTEKNKGTIIRLTGAIS